MDKVVLKDKEVAYEPNPIQNFGYQEIMKLVQALPDQSRAIFNMYALEGFTHKEIAEQLGISEGTSKWHLFEARRILKLKIDKI